MLRCDLRIGTIGMISPLAQNDPSYELQKQRAAEVNLDRRRRRELNTMII